MESIEYLWKDRKRHLGLPLSFTRYRLSEDRLFCETASHFHGRHFTH